MKITLVNDKGKYVKELDAPNAKLYFTSDKKKAKGYQDEWFATTEKEFIEFHFKGDENVSNLKATYVDTY